jgi:hypothetical protein
MTTIGKIHIKSTTLLLLFLTIFIVHGLEIEPNRSSICYNLSILVENENITTYLIMQKATDWFFSPPTVTYYLVTSCVFMFC